LARETERVDIGVLVYGNTHRHPAILAKEIVTIDHVSNGRAILGIGAGWNENEHRWYGWELPAPGPRIRMFDEAMTVITGLFNANERFSFDGEFYTIDNAPFSRSEEHTSELQSRENLVCRLLLEKKKTNSLNIFYICIIEYSY